MSSGCLLADIPLAAPALPHGSSLLTPPREPVGCTSPYVHRQQRKGLQRWDLVRECFSLICVYDTHQFTRSDGSLRQKQLDLKMKVFGMRSRRKEEMKKSA
ncbi:Kinesin-Like Protein Kif26B [Manis pentadactyla]|nr:Kinesin-Like Protein Kif26B [Manis pentadactyla]